MKRSLPLLIVLCLIAPLLFAQKGGNGGGGGGNQNQNQNQNQNGQSTPTPTVINMWRCNLPGGSYSVALRAVVSVSSQQYLVDAHTQVTEVDIDTLGCALARFYYLEPNTPSTSGPLGGAAGTLNSAQQLLQQGADATGQDVWQKVVKNYPTTTHAKTIEYRIQDKATLTQLYTSAEGALRLNQNTVFTPTTESGAQ
jgi:hypothetical protein